MTAIPNDSVLPTLSVGALIQVEYAFDSSYLMTAAQIPGSAVGALQMRPYAEGAEVVFTITEYDYNGEQAKMAIGIPNIGSVLSSSDLFGLTRPLVIGDGPGISLVLTQLTGGITMEVSVGPNSFIEAVRQLNAMWLSWGYVRHGPYGLYNIAVVG